MRTPGSGDRSPDRVALVIAVLLAGLAALILFHLVQVLFSALAWRAVAGPARPQPTLLQYVGLRWIREGVNNLLPVAQIGGEVVAVQLLRRHGLRLADAVAGSVGDLTMEMVTQVGFTLFGLGLLVLLVGATGQPRERWDGLADVADRTVRRRARCCGQAARPSTVCARSASDWE